MKKKATRRRETLGAKVKRMEDERDTLVAQINQMEDERCRWLRDLRWAESERDAAIKIMHKAIAHDARATNLWIGIATKVADTGRVLPGLYAIDADGRPAFSSQAAADFVNAMNAFDAARSGVAAKVNQVPQTCCGGATCG